MTARYNRFKSLYYEYDLISGKVNQASYEPGFSAVNFSNQYTAEDAFGFSLNYFAGDYQAITGQIKFPELTGSFPAQHYRPLYNGNISSIAESIDKMSTKGLFGGKIMLYNYKYDQLLQ
ncbi:hypothetical protein ACX0G7_16470 [Flavitalea antarctica]